MRTARVDVYKRQVLALCCLAASAAAEAPIEITVAMNGTPTGWPASEDENFIQQQILEKTGVRFVMSPLDNYAQTLNLLVANDDAPDMFIVNADTMRTYAAQDMLLDLTPYKETGLKCIFDKFGDSVDTPYLYYNDRMYMIPTNDYQDNAYYTMYFRQDWADKLNLQAPTTVEGLFEFCSAIAAADLDQNGQKDTIGFTCLLYTSLDHLLSRRNLQMCGNRTFRRDRTKFKHLCHHAQPALAQLFGKALNKNGCVLDDLGLGNEGARALNAL